MPPSLEEIRSLITPIVVSRLHGVPRSEVEDVCQEAWIACWQKLSCQSVGDWKAFCSQVARHKAADVIRRRESLQRMLDHIKRDHPEFDGADWDLPSEIMIQRAVYLIIRFFLEHRTKCAETANLRFFQSLPWDQVGRRLSSTAEAVRQQWHRCVTFLLERIGGEVLSILDGRVDDSEALP